MSSQAAAAAAAAAAATAVVGGGRSMTNEVWHVRHGERCDEVRGAERWAWERSPRYKKGGWFDPFLTCHGHAQARRAGLYLNSLPFNQQPGGFDIVYTSPLIRAVQTAVCVSQGLGNLPLQVVPGLASCTAALRRIGYAQAEATLMTDAEIVETFPGVTVVPRDPLAPTSFSGAAAWLADKAGEKKGTGGDGESCSRVLAVGHREGTKAMAGRKVPTPHCCISIFRAEASEKSCTYELHDLLSHSGKSLKSKGESSPYARRTRTIMGEENGPRGDSDDSNDGDGAVGALAARVIALTVSTGDSKPKAKGLGAEAVARKRASTGERASSTRSTTTSSRNSSSGGATQDDHNRHSPSPRAAGLVRRVRGASLSLLSTAGKGKPPAASSRASGKQAGREKKGQDLAAREPPRRTPSEGKGKRRESVVGGATSGGGDDRKGPPPGAKEVGSRQPAAVATNKSGRVVSSPASMGGGENPGLVAPRGGACAGRGFRVVRYSSRRGSVGGSSFAGLLGIPVDMLCGQSGVLSFLSPTELCTAQATCKPVATAAASEYLWSELYLRLPKGLRNRSESDLLLVGRTQATPLTERTHLHPKTLFARAVSTTSSSHAAKIARKVAVVRRRLAVIHNLRGSVVAMKANVKVRLNGEPVSVVQTTGVRAEAWVSRSSLLSEPSVNSKDGVRTFSLSSSVKVDVPASLETVKLLRSMCVALSWPDKDAALLPRIAVVRIDDFPFLSQARLLGTSADSAVALYDVAGSSCSNGSSANRLCTRKGGDGGGIISPASPALRGCALLGVLPSRRHDGRQDSDSDAGGVAFLTVHFPHDLLLDVATHRRSGASDNNPSNNGSDSCRSRSYGDDSAGPKHGLENFAAALGLRTAGVPLWEKASIGIGGRICSPGSVVSRRKQPLKDGESGVAVVCVDILRPGTNDAACFGGSERMLSAGPGLPYSTPGGLSGIVADVLLADFTLCDPDGTSLWAFASPIVFEACLTAAVAAGVPGGSEGSGGGSEDDDCTIDMAHKEIREERRRGIVAEPGVGKVVVELALVESTGEDDEDERARSTATQRRCCPAGHVWMVRSARVELELEFVNTWFGTKHDST